LYLRYSAVLPHPAFCRLRWTPHADEVDRIWHDDRGRPDGDFHEGLFISLPIMTVRLAAPSFPSSTGVEMVVQLSAQSERDREKIATQPFALRPLNNSQSRTMARVSSRQ
jgi:hypothetical protein